jgi:hypothetical protein
VTKSLITIDYEGGHASVERELRAKALWAKASIEELKLPKPEVLNSRRAEVVSHEDVTWR